MLYSIRVLIKSVISLTVLWSVAVEYTHWRQHPTRHQLYGHLLPMIFAEE